MKFLKQLLTLLLEIVHWLGQLVAVSQHGPGECVILEVKDEKNTGDTVWLNI